MGDLNDHFYEDGTDDVMAVFVNNLLASTLRSEYNNAEILTVNRELINADKPIQVFDGDGSSFDVLLPEADTEENHPFLLVNGSGGSEVLTIKSNDGAVTYTKLKAGQAYYGLPDGSGSYVTVWSGAMAWGDFVEQGSAPGSPASGLWRLYFKSDGLYTKDDAGVETGPLGAGGGGLSVVVASVTTTNVTVTENTHFILNLAGLTGDRDFPLPTPSAAGVKVKMTVSAGDDTYHLLLKVNSVEVERAFITNETIEFTAYGTGAGDWAISQNDLIKQHGMMERTTGQSINNSTVTKLQLATAVINVGDICDTTNYRITPRRDKNYEISLFGSMGNVFEDQEYLEIEAYVNGALKKFYASHTSTASTNRYQSPSLTFKMPLAAGDDVEFYILHTEGATQNTDTTYPPQLAVLEV